MKMLLHVRFAAAVALILVDFVAVTVSVVGSIALDQVDSAAALGIRVA
jgi:hypothetical protein